MQPVFKVLVLRERDTLGLVCGTDMIEIKRMEQTIRTSGQRFLERVFTANEILYCESRRSSKMQSYAARFAAKEAVVKALGTGIAKGIEFQDVEIENKPSGCPTVKLHNNAKRVAEEEGIQEFAISISHCKDYAVAYVVAEKK